MCCFLQEALPDCSCGSIPLSPPHVTAHGFIFGSQMGSSRRAETVRPSSPFLVALRLWEAAWALTGHHPAARPAPPLPVGIPPASPCFLRGHWKFRSLVSSPRIVHQSIGGAVVAEGTLFPPGVPSACATGHTAGPLAGQQRGGHRPTLPQRTLAWRKVLETPPGLTSPFLPPSRS